MLSGTMTLGALTRLRQGGTYCVSKTADIGLKSFHQKYGSGCVPLCAGLDGLKLRASSIEPSKSAGVLVIVPIAVAISLLQVCYAISWASALAAFGSQTRRL